MSISKITKAQKEQLINQHGKCIWFTGLSGAGKSTIAIALEEKMHAEGLLTLLLDGDVVRDGINNNLGFSEEDRMENIRRVSEIAKMAADSGIVVLCGFISPTEEIRELARSIIGSAYFEVFVDTPLEVCEERDVKGLYKKARAGEIENFTGIDSAFDAPLNADMVVKTTEHSVVEIVEQVWEKTKDSIKDVGQ